MKSPTQRKIAALKPLEKRYSVALGYGLSLKVQPSGAKSFVLRRIHSAQSLRTREQGLRASGCNADAVSAMAGAPGRDARHGVSP